MKKASHLVEKYKRRRGHDQTRQRNLLPLPRRQLPAARLADYGIVTWTDRKLTEYTRTRKITFWKLLDAIVN